MKFSTLFSFLSLSPSSPHLPFIRMMDHVSEGGNKKRLNNGLFMRFSNLATTIFHIVLLQLQACAPFLQCDTMIVVRVA